ncbi:MAG: NUDIX hydrolase [Thermoplasmata archaeon]|nr:NUDIX hydrolase [Thermoplasmata archaeon]
MRISVERPSEEEVHCLTSKYGNPMVREFHIDLRERDEIQDYPECKGGTRIAIKSDDGIVLVRAREGGVFGLPGGRIWADESVEDGAIREAEEETGLIIELRGLPEIHKCQYLFKNWNLERWIFVFVADASSGTLEPADKAEIEKAAVFQEPPSDYGKEHWLRDVWNECLSP